MATLWSNQSITWRAFLLSDYFLPLEEKETALVYCHTDGIHVDHADVGDAYKSFPRGK